MSDEIYKEKFMAFLTGIEMQNINDFIELPVEDIKVIAVIFKTIVNNSKTRELLHDLGRIDALFNSPHNG